MDEMTSLKDRLNELAYRYYVLDDPAVSDAEYDALYDKLVALEKSTGVVLPVTSAGCTVSTSARRAKSWARGWTS